MIGSDGATFTMFSYEHILVVFTIVLSLFALLYYRNAFKQNIRNRRTFEKGLAISLLAVEWFYYAWMYGVGKWAVHYSLPLELCSISLYATIILLWTNDRRLYPFVFFAGIGGGFQALFTPDLELGYPHFRFFHFFYVHGGIIFTALYFTWIKGYRPTFRELVQTLLVLNVIAALVYVVNQVVDGNYMFLRMKPSNGSLLDYLGPYPYYLLSLEVCTFVIFTVLWLLFKRTK